MYRAYIERRGGFAIATSQAKVAEFEDAISANHNILWMNEWFPPHY